MLRINNRPVTLRALSSIASLFLSQIMGKYLSDGCTRESTNKSEVCNCTQPETCIAIYPEAAWDRLRPRVTTYLGMSDTEVSRTAMFVGVPYSCTSVHSRSEEACGLTKYGRYSAPIPSSEANDHPCNIGTITIDDAV